MNGAGLTPFVAASAMSVSTEMPSHTVSSFVHFVTQWISRVTSVLGSARNSSHVQWRGRRARRRR